MSELCLSSTSKTLRFSSPLKPGFFLFCSFVLSLPLYFSYFIVFSPFILKLLSFLSPLFITTSLLLLAFLTISPSFLRGSLPEQPSEVKASFLAATYHAIVQRLRSKIDDQDEEHLRLEDFEVFRIVFGSPTIHDANVSQVEVLEPELADSCSFQASAESQALPSFGHQDSSTIPNEASANDVESGSFGHLLTPNDASGNEVESGNFADMQSNWGAMEEEQRIGCLLQEMDEFEAHVKETTIMEKKTIEPYCTDANKAIENRGEKSVGSNGSEEAGNDNKIRQSDSVGKANDREYRKSKLQKAHSHSIGASADYTSGRGDYFLRIQSSPSLDCSPGSYGSARKEKEWRRTLACKLFEERNNGDESEGMDYLWERYETESTKKKANSKKESKKKKGSTPKKKYETKYPPEGEGIGDGEDEGTDGQLCCLQALKLSSGKMNLGMGRPNLVKISKAIKGIGWLQNMNKKVHNRDTY